MSTDKITGIKIKQNDGTYSNQVPLWTTIENISYDNTHTLSQALGTINIENDGNINQQLNALKLAIGSPLTASIDTDMIDTTKIYVYTGTTTTDFINGHWYFYNGSEWTDGGIYNSTAINIDKTLAVEDIAADAYYTGDIISKATSNIRYVPTEGAYISTSGATTDFTLVDSSSSSYVKIRCESGDQFTITAKSGLNGRAYAFVTEDGTILAAATANKSYTDLIITAPSNSYWLICNSYQSELFIYKGVLLTQRVKNNKEKIDVVEKSLTGMFDIISTSGSIVTFETSTSGIVLNKLIVNLSPSLTGYTQCKLLACGKNLFNLADFITGGWTSRSHQTVKDYYTGNKFNFYHLRGDVSESSSAIGLLPFRKPLGRITTSMYKTTDTNDRIYFHYTNASSWTDYANYTSTGRKTRTSDANKICDGVAFDTTQGSSATGYLGEVQIELNASRTTYEPFNGTSTTISFNNIGTIYGGTLDILNGTLTVTHGYINEYNEEELPGQWLSSLDTYEEGTLPTIGANVVYELSNPLIYQLEPLQITTQKGINHIFTNIGDVYVEYREDISKINTKIDNCIKKELIAFNGWESSIAINNIAQGSYFISNNALYIATTAIAKNNEIIPGTNCILTNIVDALNAIKLLN